MTLQELLEDYANLRSHIEAEEAKLKPFREALENLQAAVLARLNQDGLDTAKTRDGHRINIIRNQSARVVDAEAFFDFVFDTGDSAFLQKRVTTETVTRFIEETGNTPPGVELTLVNSLRFTKAK